MNAGDPLYRKRRGTAIRPFLFSEMYRDDDPADSDRSDPLLQTSDRRRNGKPMSRTNWEKTGR